MTGQRVVVCLLSALVAIASTACSSETLVDSRPRGNNIADFVTGNAAKGIGADGRFVLATSAGSPVRELTRTEAEAYAQAWTTEFGPLLSDILEEGHGGPIRYERLRVCRQSVYAASPFEPLDSTVATTARGSFGGWWLVALCEDGVVEISLGIEAIGTGLTLTGGKIGFAADSNGGHFFALGVPSWWDGPVPMSAERAVVEASLATGLRISEVPRLIVPWHFRGPPQLAVWQLPLDGAALVRGNGTRLGGYMAEVYEGPLVWGPIEPTLLIPLPNQPTVEIERYPFGDVTVKIKSALPIYFEAGTVTRTHE